MTKPLRLILIYGSRLSDGKTALAMALKSLLPGSEVIRIEKRDKKQKTAGNGYHQRVTLNEIADTHGRASWLIIETDSVFKDATHILTISLDAAKTSGTLSEEKADIISGQYLPMQSLRRQSEKTGLAASLIQRIAWLSGARPGGANAIVLAGGESLRMGRNKPALEVEGATLLQASTRSLLTRFDKVYVVGSDKPLDLPPGTVFVKDKVLRQGPLMAIKSGLDASDRNVNFILAVDIPQVDFVLVREMLSWSESYDIVLPSFGKGRVEPLFAVYHKTAAQVAERLLRRNIRKVSELFEELNTKILSVSQSKWYFNLNTPEDLKKYLIYRKSRA